jgi:hypothetical protein
MDQNPRALTNRPDVRADELDRMQQRVDDLRVAICRDVHEVESRIRRAFDPRLLIAKHPFVAAAVVLGGVFVVTRIVQSVFRRVRAPEENEFRRRRVKEFQAVALASGRRAGVSEASMKEAPE